jgi:hypothetical protein
MTVQSQGLSPFPSLFNHTFFFNPQVMGIWFTPDLEEVLRLENIEREAKVNSALLFLALKAVSSLSQIPARFPCSFTSHYSVHHILSKALEVSTSRNTLLRTCPSSQISTANGSLGPKAGRWTANRYSSTSNALPPLPGNILSEPDLSTSTRLHVYTSIRLCQAHSQLHNQLGGASSAFNSASLASNQ